MDIVTDASPWGIGGYLVIADKILSYFSCPLTAEVERVLQMKIGESSSQQVAEALAVLVALRGWKKIWMKQQISLQVKSDSKWKFANSNFTR